MPLRYLLFALSTLPKPLAGLAAVAVALALLGGCQTARPPQEAPGEPSAQPDSAPPETAAAAEPAPPEPKPLPSPQPQRQRPSLKSQAASLGLQAEELEDGKTWLLSDGERRLILAEDSRLATLDGITVFLNRPFAQVRGKHLLSDVDLETVVKPAFGLSQPMPLRSRLVMLDPGHGGSDEGSRNERHQLVEKNLNLEIASRVQERLKEKGIESLLTRYDDRALSLEDRAQIANRAEAGLFVSLHFNGAANKEANGIETFILTPSGERSTAQSEATREEGTETAAGNRWAQENFKLGFALHSQMVRRLQREDRGLKTARFKVLQDIECPGALLEGGFLSNDAEALLISTPVFREKLARAIAEAIDGYLQKASLDDRSS